MRFFLNRARFEDINFTRSGLPFLGEPFSETYMYMYLHARTWSSVVEKPPFSHVNVDEVLFIAH